MSSRYSSEGILQPVLQDICSYFPPLFCLDLNNQQKKTSVIQFVFGSSFLQECVLHTKVDYLSEGNRRITF